ncbi:MAG TPA: hypothetical protein VGU74_03380 [Gemmatimonadales bacterium]|nr:hypothetical protein [Gemmatimonadales bacterium]
MKRWVLSGIVIAAGVIVIACGERGGRADMPSGPMASVTTLTTLPACDLSGTNSLVSQYFNSTDAKAVRALIDQIGAAGAGSVIARDRGFDIIAVIAQNAQAGTGGAPVAASNLINNITPCMFRNLAEFPENYPEDYTVAVTTAAPGALGVRGGAADPASDLVLSRGSFSGVAPQLGVTWATTLGGNPAPARIAFYGRPGSTSQTYDWKVLPRNASFSPPAVVGVCVDLNAVPTAMLHEEHVGLLTFSEAYFLDPTLCGAVSSGRGLSAFTHQLAQLFLPQTLAAASTTRGIGGSTGGIGSEFGLNDVPNVSLVYTIQPPASVLVGQTFTVQLRATDAVTGATVGGTQVSIIAVNNNGVPKTLLGTLSQTTNNAGLATFGDLSFDPGSTGGYRLVVGGTVVGRQAISVGQATSTKVNAKPAK